MKRTNEGLRGRSSARRPRPLPPAAPKAAVPIDESTSRGVWAALAVLTVVSLALRAWRLNDPATPVYDESYMGVIVNKYRHGREWFFDIHPPFSRLVYYYIPVVLLGAPECAYSKTMEFATCEMWQMRTPCCVLGTALVPLSFAILRAMGCSPRASLLAAFFASFDTMLLVLSRIHLLDMVTTVCIALVAWTHALFLRACRTGTPRIQVALVLLTEGVCLGCALSSKFGVTIPTSLWCAAWNGLAAARGQIRWSTAVTATAVLAVLSALTYLALLWWHFQLIPWKDPEVDQSYAAYVLYSRRVNGQPLSLVDRFCHELLLELDFSHESTFVDQVLDFTLDQWFYYWSLDNYDLEVVRPPNSHHSHSCWYSWLFGYRGLLFGLFQPFTSGLVDAVGVYFLPNVAIVWASTLGLLASASALLLRQLGWDVRRTALVNGSAGVKHPSAGPSSGALATKVATAERAAALLLPLFLGWLLHLLPFLSVRRETFVIYYVFAYFFALLLLATLTDLAAAIAPATTRACTVGLVAASLAFFVYAYPVAIGDMPVRDYLQRFVRMTPGCWFGDCINVVPGSTVAAALQAGMDITQLLENAH